MEEGLTEGLTEGLPFAGTGLIGAGGEPMICSISEMYDLCTVKDKIGVIGIHTPNMNIIARSWKGFIDQHKYIKLLGCDVRIACASHQPLDPLQIGTSGDDKIAPQDLMNPILYRACTNDSWNTIINRVYASGGTDTGSIKYDSAPFTVNADTQERAYYALLASNEWRKAMPQIGLEMRNLRPFVYTVLDTYGQAGTETMTGNVQGALQDNNRTSNDSGAPASVGSTSKPLVLKGHPVPYPAIPTNVPGDTVSNESDYPVMANANIPKSYVACILMPPSKLQIMYYRLLVTWRFEFIKPVPLYEKYQLTEVGTVGMQMYTRDYSFVSSKTAEVVDKDSLSEDNTVDTVDASLKLVLQK